MAERQTFETKEEWLQARVQDVTSTAVAALPCFNVNPYQSPLDLFLEKQSKQVVTVEPNDRMRWGLRLQDTIARGVAEDLGVTVRKLNQYIRLPENRLGSSFDFEVVSHEDGPGLMEIKTVGNWAFRQGWTVEDNKIESAPAHVELQFQTELLVSGRKWGYIVALVDSNEVMQVRRCANERVQDAILKGVGEFWAMVGANIAPPVDYVKDADLILRLNNLSTEGKILDGTGDQDLSLWVSDYIVAREQQKVAEAKIDEMKVRIIDHIADAEKVVSPFWSISAKTTKGSPGTLVTPEMVGTHIGGRAAFRAIRITPKKEGKKK